MNKQTENTLREWAKEYNTPSFIEKDPISLPHIYKRMGSELRDIEISAFITAWMSYGRREVFIAKAMMLHSIMDNIGGPYAWIMSDEKDKELSLAPLRELNKGKRDTCYRFYTYQDYLDLCSRLKSIYTKFDSLEEALSKAEGDNPVEKLQALFAGINGIPALGKKAACKRLAMFLRWMVRTDGIVDFGIWKKYISPIDLIIPLDTHVYQTSIKLGLTKRKAADLTTAIEITEALKTIFPDDPCLGDFSLFGYGVNQQ
jgi:TIGR02757 family protein